MPAETHVPELREATLQCPGFIGERVTVVGPYTAHGAQPDEYVIRRADDSTMAVRRRDFSYTPRAYSGPFDAPPLELMPRAIGWRFVKRYPSADRWEPTGWEIVYPDGVLTVDYRSQLATRDSILYAPASL